jgi:hypothetical protein
MPIRGPPPSQVVAEKQLSVEKGNTVSEVSFLHDRWQDGLHRSDDQWDPDDSPSPFLPSNARLRDRTRQINAESNPTLLHLRARIVMKRIISELGILAESLLICLPGSERVTNILISAKRLNPNPEVLGFTIGNHWNLQTSSRSSWGSPWGSFGTRG